jgi:hypothetical protein
MTDDSTADDEILAGMPGRPPVDTRKLADLVNRVLDKGVVLGGDVTISVAGVDLVFLRLSALLTSVATAQEKLNARGGGWVGDRPPGEFLGESTEIQVGPPPIEHAPGEALPAGAAERSARGRPADVSLPEDRGPAPLAEALTADIARVSQGFPQHVDIDPDAVQRDLARLVLTVVELLRRVVEHQAVRRIDDPTLTDQQVERVGIALERLDEKMREITSLFGLAETDLNIDLGDLGTLL